MAYWVDHDSGDSEPDFFDHCYEDDDYEDDSEDEDRVPQRSSYVPEIPPAAIKSIILEAMEEEDVKAGEVPNEGRFITPQEAEQSRRYFEAKGFAWFSCPRRHKRWPSAQSWCFIDLKKQAICHRDQQKCNKCETKASPEFTKEALKRMAENVVRKFLIRMGRKRPVFVPRSTDTGDTQGGPHDERRCDKCKRLGRSCWK